ncbi:hypothetical protein HCC61_17345 [Streptomyces sp. HNM0575]|uniref:hypothetical protein n=1 Tax=Streptomyces sp. HNM0575 TaxID=2716338 RepID=UPI00145E923B|nr:hypothetical protein [Streptomyces sp. HNM0575]NLU74425.1 hypothetical protein [Streptomyces sp. HNM0575]
MAGEEVAVSFEDLYRLGDRLGRVYEWSRDLAADLHRTPAPDVGDSATRHRLVTAVDDRMPKARKLAMELEKAARGVKKAAAEYQRIDGEIKKKVESGGLDPVSSGVLNVIEDVVLKGPPSLPSSTKILDDFG